MGDISQLKYFRAVLGKIPAGPRCKLCAAPLKAAGKRDPEAVRIRPVEAQPATLPGVLPVGRQEAGRRGDRALAAVRRRRGSTSLAEHMQPQEFSRLISRFYGTAARVVDEWDGIVDKFVGDEAVALFVPGFAGEEHASRAVGGGTLASAGDGNDGPEPWVPIGIGVHTGVAYVGRVGEGDACDFTAVGDAVNTTATARVVGRSRGDPRQQGGGRVVHAGCVRARVPDAHAAGRDEMIDALVARRLVVLAHVAAKRRSSSSTSSAQRRAFGRVTSFPHGERSAMPCTPPGTRT